MTPELIIAGFHRSGTSFTAQTLHQHGLFLGDDLLGAAPSNPYGHFEDRTVVTLHDDLLRDNGETWQVDRPLLPVVQPAIWDRIESFVSYRRGRHTFWGFKDPRACLFLGLWRHIMPDARLVAVYRPYWSSVSSLHRRHGYQLAVDQPPADVHLRFFEEPDLALRMWINHNLALIRECRAFAARSLVVSFDALAKGFPLVQRLRDRWSLPLDRPQLTSSFDPGATDSGRHVRIFDPALRERADDIMKQLEELHVD